MAARRPPALLLIALLALTYHAVVLAGFLYSYRGAGLLYSRIVVGHSNGRLVAACSAARVARLPSGINGSVLWVHGSEWRILGGPALCDGMHVQGIGIVAANASSLVDAGGSLVAIHTALLPRGLEIYWSIEYIGPSGLLEQLAAIAVAVIAASWSARVRVSLASALLGATLYTLLAAALAAAIAIVMGDAPLYLIGVRVLPFLAATLLYLAVIVDNVSSLKTVVAATLAILIYLYVVVTHGPAVINALEGVLAASHTDRPETIVVAPAYIPLTAALALLLAAIAALATAHKLGESIISLLTPRPRQAYILAAAIMALYSILPDPALATARIFASAFLIAAAIRLTKE